jgi:multidrug efflux system membrane fusion protein
MPPPPRARTPAWAVLVGFTVTLGCARPPAARPEPPPAPVVVAAAVTKTVPVQLRAIGSVKAIATVSVRPRVSGELTEVHFKEGDDVAREAELFTIDPRPYEAAVKQAEANLAKDAAVLAGAELELRRIERGTTGGVLSAAELDTARTAVATARATQAADEAALNSAKLQAGFTRIRAPIAGRTGGLLVTPGNLVGPTDANPLVVINQISPIHVAFSLPEQQLSVVVAAARAGPLAVEADPRGGGPPAAGVLAFIDNAVDPATGMVQLKAEFKNADRRLWPGQFVDVVLTLGERTGSVVVPAAAVQTGQQGQYVFVVTPDKKAELRPVTVAFEQSGEAVLASGLAGGETVVVEGQLRLAPGVRVEVKGSPGPVAPSRPTAAPNGTAGEGGT